MTGLPDLAWYVARASGFTAWWLSSLAVIWGLLLATRVLDVRVTPAWLLDLHRTLAGTSVAFALAHVGAVTVSSQFLLDLPHVLVPLLSPTRRVPAAWGIAAMYLLLAVQISSLLRRRLPDRAWWWVHRLTFGIFVVTTIHTFLAGTDVHTWWAEGSASLLAAAVLFLTVYRVLVGRRELQLREAAVAGAAQLADHPTSPAFHRLTVGRADVTGEDAAAVSFLVPAELAEAYRYVPGQHLTLRATVDGAEVRRAYSICSGLGDGELRIGVRVVPGGRMSRHVASLRSGDQVEVMTPAGDFTDLPNPLAARHVVCVAAGSGITPVLSILTSVLLVEPRSRVTLVYGNRTPGTAMFRHELAALTRRYGPRLRQVDAYSEHGERPERISAELLARLDLGLVDDAYLCGPEPMLVAVRQALVALGTPEQRVHAERYSAAGTRTVGAAGTLRVVDGSTTVTLPTRAGESLLAAALRAAAPIPYSCQAGACGTCRVWLVSGAVTGEVDARGGLLACQSGLASDAVTVALRPG